MMQGAGSGERDAGFTKFEVMSLKCLKLQKENSDLNF